MITDASHGSPLIKPPLWAIDPGIVAYNASRMELPMPVVVYVWDGLDLSGNHIIGTAVNGLDFNDPQGWDFGWYQDRYIDLGTPDALNFTTSDFTIATSIIMTKTNGFFFCRRIFNNAGYFLANAGPNWHIQIVNGASYPQAYGHTGTLVLNKRYQVTGVRRGMGLLELYQDGKEVETYSIQNNAINPGDSSAITTYIGRNNDGGNDFMGWMDYMYVFSEAFLPSQIATISADPYGLVRQPSMEELWAYATVVGGVAPTGVFYGPLFGPLGGPI